MSVSLHERQQAVFAAILDDAAPLPDGWSNRQMAGLDVYRGNYRSALMGALEDTYERTRRHVGEGAFRTVGIHHLIAHPPTGWTIDASGCGFEETCKQLFRDNPEVAELAWLEWAMRELAVGPDSEPLLPETFAKQTAAFGDEDWANMRLAFQPRCAARLVAHDLECLWRALETDGTGHPDPRLPDPQTCLVWREGERPTFILTEADHAAAFAAMQGGGSYADAIMALLADKPDATPEAIRQAATRLGAMLGLWLREGLVVAVNP